MTTAPPQTLAAIARAIFQDWFTDFGPVRAKLEGHHPYLPKAMWKLFPEDLVQSRLGPIPRGWTTAPLGRMVSLIRNVEEPGRSPSKTFNHFSIPAYDRGATPRRELGSTILSAKLQVPPGAVLLSKLNPEIERVWLVDKAPGKHAVCSTEFLVLSPKPPMGAGYLYCLARSEKFRQQLQSLAAGTSPSHQRAQASSIMEIPVLNPPDAVVERFGQITAPMFARRLTSWPRGAETA